MAKKKTYADEAKTIMNKYKPRLGEKFDKGDTLALEAMNQELTALREKQERARVQGLVDGASPEQISQLSQAFQAQNNQGPEQPGIPQGGPSGLAGGQAPQATGQPQFQGGGRLEDIPNRLRGTLGNLNLSRNTPFIGNLLQGQNVPLSQGQNQLGQQIVFPENLGIDTATQQGNFVPFGDSRRDARRFSRQAPNVANRIGIQRFSGSEQPQFATGGDLLPMLQDGGYSINPANFLGQPEYPESERQLNYFQDYFQDLDQGVYPKPYDRFAAGRGTAPWSPFGAKKTGQPAPTLTTPSLIDVANQGYQYDPNQIGTPQNIIAPGGGQTGTAGPITGAGRIGGGNVPATTGGGGVPATQSIPNFAPGNIDRSGFGAGGPGINPIVRDTLPGTVGEALAAQTGSAPADTGIGTPTGDFGTPYETRVPWWGAAATGLGSILGNRQLDLGRDQLSPEQVSPHLVDYSREREQLKRDRDISQSMIQRNAAQGGSRAALMQNIQAGATGTQRVLGRGLSTSFQNQGNVNAQIRNQAAQFNAQQRGMANRINAQYNRENQLINAQRRQNQIAGVTGAITGYGRDLMASDKFDIMAQIQAPENYKFNTIQDSLFRQIFGINPVGAYQSVDTGTRLTK